MLYLENLPQVAPTERGFYRIYFFYTQGIPTESLLWVFIMLEEQNPMLRFILDGIYNLNRETLLERMTNNSLHDKYSLSFVPH